MNGVHDFGGMHGYGPVRPEPAEPLFHADWERRALAVTLAMGATGQWNIDMARSARESLPPRQYLSSTYYEIWIAGLERLMLERRLVHEDELAAGRALHPPQPVARRLAADRVAAALAAGSPTGRPAASPARFAVGDAVRMRNDHPLGHTRLPRYARGRVGEVVAVRGAHVFADRHALPMAGGGFDDTPEWLYTVRFEGRELWGAAAEAGTAVSIDAWEPFMEPADIAAKAERGA